MAKVSVLQSYTTASAAQQASPETYERCYEMWQVAMSIGRGVIESYTIWDEAQELWQNDPKLAPFSIYDCRWYWKGLWDGRDKTP